MYLAMVWNRVDIAEEKIFSNRELVWKEGELDMVMSKPSSSPPDLCRPHDAHDPHNPHDPMIHMIFVVLMSL